MRSLARCALTIGAAAALLAGCSLPFALRQAQDDSAQGKLAQGDKVPPVAARAVRGGSWMLPEAVGRDLLYVSKPFYSGARDVYIYTYPRGHFVGRLNGLGQPEGECVDKNGNVFVVDAYVDAYDSAVYEFAHGGTSPIATLTVPYAGATGCSIDPTAEKLAVSGGSRGASVAIFAYDRKRGWRFPKTYSLPAMANGAFCGYDNAGDLFVDGTNDKLRFKLAELPRSANAFTSITLNQRISVPGQVQWHDNVLAVGDSGASRSVIYQFSISGSRGTEVDSTTLAGANTLEEFWIQGKTVIAADYGGNDVGFWPYPSGGSASHTISLRDPFGVTVSLAQR